jgi:hypothetical protein
MTHGGAEHTRMSTSPGASPPWSTWWVIPIPGCRLSSCAWRTDHRRFLCQRLYDVLDEIRAVRLSMGGSRAVPAIVDSAAGVSTGTRANVTRARCSARDVASRWLVASVTPRRTMFAQAERHRSSRQPCRRKHSAYPRSTRLPSGTPRFPLCQQAHPVSRARGAALACAR